MKKRIFLAVFIVLVGLILWNFKLVSYGIAQGIGQLEIVWNAKPVSEYLQDDDVPDSTKQKLIFIEEVRDYAVNQLGLNNTDNYTTMYDQKGEPILWVVTGCEPFDFKAKEWEFPVLGKVPYKGFFDKEKAKKAYEVLKEQGYDAGIRTVGGWSRLGWFSDPILSNMLERDWGDLANLIIHELVHATIFVKDSISFNENLASFIAHEGALRFLEDKYGKDSKEYKNYQIESHDLKLQIDHILRGTESLRALYASITKIPEEEKIEAKQKLITQIMNTSDTLSFQDSSRSNRLRGKQPNNTYFMSYMRYEAKQQDLSALYEEKFNRNLNDFIIFLKEKHPFL